VFLNVTTSCSNNSTHQDKDNLLELRFSQTNAALAAMNTWPDVRDCFAFIDNKKELKKERLGLR
jgi:hypothetical protein